MLIEKCSGSIKARTGGGKLRITGVRGQVDAATGGGALEIEGAVEVLDASSERGLIEIRLQPQSRMKDDWMVQGGEGGVRIYIPDAFAADLDVSTSDSEISLDPLLKVDGEFAKRRLTGKLGGGGKLLRIHCSNGNVSLLR